MSIEHTVVWDGRRSGPGGAYIFAAEQPPLPAPPPSLRIDHSSDRETIARLLRRQPLTMRAIVAESGIGMHDVNAALSQMQRHGVIEIAGMVPRVRGDGSRAFFSRSKERLYQIVEAKRS